MAGAPSFETEAQKSNWAPRCDSARAPECPAARSRRALLRRNACAHIAGRKAHARRDPDPVVGIDAIEEGDLALHDADGHALHGRPHIVHQPLTLGVAQEPEERARLAVVVVADAVIVT